VDVARSSCFPNPHFAFPHRLTSGITALESCYPFHVNSFPSSHASQATSYVLPLTSFGIIEVGPCSLSIVLHRYLTISFLQLATALQLFGLLVSLFLHRVVVSICTGISCSMHSKFRSVFKKPDISHTTELS
jgi:hypothetical protein